MTESDGNGTEKLAFRPRDLTDVSLKVPVDVLESLRKVATARDMSVEALLRFYVGDGLRQDVSRYWGDRVLETVEEVLPKHIASKEEVDSIIEEIRSESARGVN